MTAVLLAHGGYHTLLGKGRLLPNTSATRNPWMLPGSCSLPAMMMPSATKRISKTSGLQHMTKATQKPWSLSPSAPSERHAAAIPNLHPLKPPMPPPTLSFLADGLASYSREKIEAIRLVHTLLPTFPPLSGVPHAHPCSAFIAFYFQSKDSSKANVFLCSWYPVS